MLVKKGFGIDYQKATDLALEIKSLYEMNIDIGLIIGAGNIFRGVSSEDELWIGCLVIILV